MSLGYFCLPDCGLWTALKIFLLLLLISRVSTQATESLTGVFKSCSYIASVQHSRTSFWHMFDLPVCSQHQRSTGHVNPDFIFINIFETHTTTGLGNLNRNTIG